MSDLINIKTVIPSLRLDIRYATTDNFTGIKLHPVPLAYLTTDAANDLNKVQADLKQLGLGLVVWDAYRPLSTTQQMWKLSLEKNSNYIADPKIGSIHNRGCAVDVTLQDISSELNLDMPTDFDDFTVSANPLSTICTDNQRDNRDLLIATMQKHNFIVDNYEWWHFNWCKWKEHPILNLDFKSL